MALCGCLPISAQLAHRAICPLGRLENSPLPGQGLRVHEGHCERVWAHRPICLLPRGLAPPFPWCRQAHPSGSPWRPQPMRGGCLRPAHQNPSPRTLNHHWPPTDQRKIQLIVPKKSRPQCSHLLSPVVRACLWFLSYLGSFQSIPCC